MAVEVSGHITLVKRKRGDHWYMKYRLAGRQVQKKIGPAWTEKGRCPEGYFTRKMAQAVLEGVLTDARRDKLDHAQPSGTTFSDAATEYLRFVTDVRQIDADTIADYRGVIDGYLTPEFGARSIQSITPDDIDAYKERLLAEGRLTNRTVVRHLTVLHGIFKRARRVWKLADNPAAADVVERPRVTYTGEFDMYDLDEIELLASYAVSDQDAAIFKVAAFTGLRQGELIGLRWDCVDFLAGMVHVRRNFTKGREKIPKGKKVRSVPMMHEVINLLGALKEREHFTADSDLVFVSEVGAHLDHFKLRERFYDAIELAGLRRLRFHDLRHCFAIAGIQEWDQDKLRGYMGHSHYSTTQRYLHHKPRPEDAAALSKAFESQRNGGVPNRVPNRGISAATERNSAQIESLSEAETA